MLVNTAEEDVPLMFFNRLRYSVVHNNNMIFLIRVVQMHSWRSQSNVDLYLTQYFHRNKSAEGHWVFRKQFFLLMVVIQAAEQMIHILYSETVESASEQRNGHPSVVNVFGRKCLLWWIKVGHKSSTVGDRHFRPSAVNSLYWELYSPHRKIGWWKVLCLHKYASSEILRFWTNVIVHPGSCPMTRTCLLTNVIFSPSQLYSQDADNQSDKYLRNYGNIERLTNVIWIFDYMILIENAPALTSDVIKWRNVLVEHEGSPLVASKAKQWLRINDNNNLIRINQWWLSLLYNTYVI